METSKWREAWASIHDDGSVTVAFAIGGHRTIAGDYATGDTIAVTALEAAIADLMALVRKNSAQVNADDYDIRIGVEWSGDAPLTFDAHGGWNSYASAVLPAYTQIRLTAPTGGSPDDFYDTVHELVRDAVNQAGAHEPQLMSARNESEQVR